MFPILSFLFHLFPIQNDNKNTCSSTMPHTLTLLSWCCVVFQRLVRAVGVPGAQGEERAILVLSANSLQKWYLAPGKADQLVYECNVEKHIRESFVDHVWVSLSVHFLSFFFSFFFLSSFSFLFFFFYYYYYYYYYYYCGNVVVCSFDLHIWWKSVRLLFKIYPH